MSEAGGTAEVSAAPRPTDPPSPPTPPEPLRRVRRFGFTVLGIQLAGFLVWSTILYDHFSLTYDFSWYNQAWFLIAHGNLDPLNTNFHDVFFWQSDSQFIIWLLAPFYWITRGSLLLPWLQDVSISAAEAVVFTWLCEVAQRHLPARDARWLACVGLLLLVANP